MLEQVEGDAYVVLGLSRDADDAAVALAHRRLARRHHPDVAGETASRRMMRINAAYDAIKTAERRAAYERDRRHAAPHDGTGAAGDPPGNASGSVLPFGRHVGWSLGEIARVDPGYLLWLAERPEGARYRDEINRLLSRLGMRTASTDPTPPWRRGVQYR
ncbi:MAG TPA: DnaJ domain-containing protein [Candidatus Limnocylindrales bacterium]|nr:DnaJ domain-containing protein [Candidatus Limnocylindrales bacterium]